MNLNQFLKEKVNALIIPHNHDKPLFDDTLIILKATESVDDYLSMYFPSFNSHDDEFVLSISDEIGYICDFLNEEYNSEQSMLLLDILNNHKIQVIDKDEFTINRDLYKNVLCSFFQKYINEDIFIDVIKNKIKESKDEELIFYFEHNPSNEIKYIFTDIYNKNEIQLFEYPIVYLSLEKNELGFDFKNKKLSNIKSQQYVQNLSYKILNFINQNKEQLNEIDENHFSLNYKDNEKEYIVIAKIN